jgi:hypothetical protein
MQIAAVLKGAPDTIKGLLETLALTNEIIRLTKTNSGGEFIIVYDNAGTANQNVYIIKGDSQKLADDLNTIIGGGETIDIVCDTFYAANYIVVSR